jgi:hypothetical protein
VLSSSSQPRIPGPRVGRPGTQAGNQRCRNGLRKNVVAVETVAALRCSGIAGRKLKPPPQFAWEGRPKASSVPAPLHWRHQFVTDSSW